MCRAPPLAACRDLSAERPGTPQPEASFHSAGHPEASRTRALASSAHDAAAQRCNHCAVRGGATSMPARTRTRPCAARPPRRPLQESHAATEGQGQGHVTRRERARAAEVPCLTRGGLAEARVLGSGPWGGAPKRDRALREVSEPRHPHQLCLCISLLLVDGDPTPTKYTIHCHLTGRHRCFAAPKHTKTPDRTDGRRRRHTMHKQIPPVGRTSPAHPAHHATSLHTLHTKPPPKSCAPCPSAHHHNDLVSIPAREFKGIYRGNFIFS